MNKGFTLVEFLIALVLLALLGLIGGALLQLFAGALNALPRQSDNTMLAFEAALHERLGKSFPIPSNARPDQIDFYGTANTVNFAAFSPGGVLNFYALQKQDGNVYLHMTSLSTEQASDLLLLQGVRHFQLRYFGTDDPFQPPKWRQSWQKAPLLPLLVQVNIEAGNRQWRLDIPLALSGVF